MWIILLVGLILLLVILFVLYVLLIALCPPRPVDECLTGSLLRNSPQVISNNTINAVINTDISVPYNLIFAGNTTVFTYDGSVIRAPDNRVWTRIEQDGGGYVRLDARREGDITQEWISADGSITSPDGNYYITLNRSGGVWYPQLTTLKDKVSCQFRFTSV